jgi:energy-coupling factor transporter ATP-binding protein EcfA2
MAGISERQPPRARGVEPGKLSETIADRNAFTRPDHGRDGRPSGTSRLRTEGRQNGPAASLLRTSFATRYAAENRSDVAVSRREPKSAKEDPGLNRVPVRRCPAIPLLMIILAITSMVHISSSTTGDWTPGGGPLPENPKLGFVPEVPDALVEACVQGQCVLYAGRGIGALAGLPTWGEGLKQVVERAEQLEPSQNWDALRSVLQSSDYLTVTDLLFARLPRETVLELVRETYATPPEKSPRVYSFLEQIPFVGVISGNWDPRIESALTARSPLALTPSDSEQFEPLLREDRFFLVNIDGDLSQPATVVFSTEEYRKAIAENDWFAKFVNGCLSSKTLLFTGTRPPAIENFLSGIRFGPQPNGPRPKHFALVPIESDFEVQRERFAAKYGIELLGFRPTAGFPQVVAFLDDLRQKVGGLQQRVGAASDPRSVTRTPCLNRIRLTNIGPFASLDLELHKAKSVDVSDSSAADIGPWNVLLGNNGCGKSTLLRAVALGLCGDDREAREAAARLLRTDERSGTIELQMGKRSFLTRLRRERDGRVVVESSVSPFQAGRWVVLGFPALRGASRKNPAGPSGEGRREPVVRDVLPLLQGVVDWRLDSVKQWMINVHTRANRADIDPAEARRARRMLESFFGILSAFVPGVSLALGDVDPRTFEVLVRTDDGLIPIDQLSQGTGSVLAWVGTLLQRMYEIYRDEDGPPEHQPALVLVDEFDAHMHPEWQQLLVPTLREKFPRLQVLATTHSPLVVLNMKPGEIIKLIREGRRPAIEAELGRPVTPDGLAPIRHEFVTESLAGLTAAQVLTETLGMLSARDVETAKTFLRYTRLAAKADRSATEEAELKELADSLNVRLPSPVQEAEAREGRDMIEKLFDERLRRMSTEKRERLLAEVTVQLQEIATGSRRLPG